jgi:hypothetical protein
MSAPIFRCAARVLLFSTILFSKPVRAEDIEDLIDKTFLDSIVKIEVSSNTPVFDKDGLNLCLSDGTGFLISKTHVVTAEHVYQLVPECGKVIIQVRSKKHNVNQIAKVLGSQNDVAILTVDQPLPDGMCALVVMSSDVYNSKGVRFGIPGSLFDPYPMHIKIGVKDTEFKPLTVLTPVSAEPGDSGGPVIYMFNVVGVTRAKHKQYPAFSFMNAGSNIRELMTRYR